MTTGKNLLLSTVFTTCWILFSQFKFRAVIQENRHNRVLKWWHRKNILFWNNGIWCRILIENPNLRPWQTRTHCCGHIVVDTNVSPLPACGTFVADTNFVSGTQKMFLILFRNILCPQQMFLSLRSPRKIMGNNVRRGFRLSHLKFSKNLSGSEPPPPGGYSLIWAI